MYIFMTALTAFVSPHRVTCPNYLSLLIFKLVHYRCYTNTNPHVIVPYSIFSYHSTHLFKRFHLRNTRIFCSILLLTAQNSEPHS
jgi:hypothetical protein